MGTFLSRPIRELADSLPQTLSLFYYYYRGCEQPLISKEKRGGVGGDSSPPINLVKQILSSKKEMKEE